MVFRETRDVWVPFDGALRFTSGTLPLWQFRAAVHNLHIPGVAEEAVAFLCGEFAHDAGRVLQPVVNLKLDLPLF